MKLRICLLILFASVLGQAFCNDNETHAPDDWPEFISTLKNPFQDESVELGISATNIYQHNVKGGLSTHRRAGRFSGSYDLELSADLQQLFNLENTRLYMLAEGSWSKSGGINAPSVGAAMNVNDDGASRRSLDVSELWIERTFDDETLILRIGKIDLTGGFECSGCPVAFDCSTFANDETTQFLNSALVNNPAIPFPQYGLAAAAYYNPVDWWYASAAIADAQADSRETGFSTAFHEEDFFFTIVETGITPTMNSANGPLQGAYRVGLWVDAQDKTRFSNGKNFRNDGGVYLSCGQMIFKENKIADDTQGLGLFGRYGWADSDLNEITNFWSFGFQYEGPFDGRDRDVIAFGAAQGIFTDQLGANDGAGYSDDHETAFELYYSAFINDSLTISPNIQYISNPGGDKSLDNALVLGLRLQMTF